MSWLQKLLPPKIKRDASSPRKVVPEGLWSKCDSCEAVLYRADLEKNLYVCPKCNHHKRVSARERLDWLLDLEGRYEIGAEVAPVDTLNFKDSRKYTERLDEALSYVKEVMRAQPPEYVYKLVLIYRTLLDAKVGPREAQTPEGRALLEEAIPVFKREIDRRPECPPLYFALYRIYKLLGNVEEERRYQDLHERKKKDFEHQEKYDQRGWPRCGT